MWEVIAYLDNGEKVVVTQDEEVTKLNPQISGFLKDMIVITSEDKNIRTYYPARVIRKIEVRKV